MSVRNKLVGIAVLTTFTVASVASAEDPVPSTPPSEAYNVEETVVVPETVEERVRRELADIPVLVDVAKCESQFRQFDTKGNVLRGKVNPQDVGIFQINEKYHLATSKQLGVDIYTIEGNIAYARWLYSQEGSAPWKWSQHCWGAVREVVLK